MKLIVLFLVLHVFDMNKRKVSIKTNCIKKNKKNIIIETFSEIALFTIIAALSLIT